MVDQSYPVTEQAFLEDNIATVAFHLGQPGARLSVSHDGPGLVVDPGEVLKEISRRLTRDDAQRLPDGFVIVPREPTPEMLTVRTEPILRLGEPHLPRVQQWRDALWRAMVDAALAQRPLASSLPSTDREGGE